MEHSKNVAKKPKPARAGKIGGHGKGPVVYNQRLLWLQTTVGNQAVQRLIDAHVRADQNAERAPGELVNEVLKTPGEPLDAETRGRMESSFGVDFSGVRVHAGSRAAESAKAVQSHAFTSGQDIVFAEGRLNPGTAEGQRLLAHELTHVVQQSAGPVTGTPTADGTLSISHPDDTFEQAAVEQAARLAESSPAAAEPLSSAAGIQRDYTGGDLGQAEKRQVQRDNDDDRPLTFPVNEEWRGRIGPTTTLPRPGANRHKRQHTGNRGGKATSQAGASGGVVGGEDKGVGGGDVGGHTGTSPQHGMGGTPSQQTRDSGPGDAGTGTNKAGGTGTQDGGTGKKPESEELGSSDKTGGEKPGRTTEKSSGGGSGSGGQPSLLGDLAELASLIMDPDSLYEAQYSENKGTGSQFGSKSGFLKGWLAQALTVVMAFGGTIKDAVKAIGGAVKKGTKKLGGWLGGESQGLLTEGTGAAATPTAAAPPAEPKYLTDEPGGNGGPFREPEVPKPSPPQPPEPKDPWEVVERLKPRKP